MANFLNSIFSKSEGIVTADQESINTKSKQPLQYDETGILKLNNGVRILSFRLCGDSVKSINDAIKYLGYEDEEVYMDTNFDDGIIAGLYKIFSGELVSVLRSDEHPMTEKEVKTHYNKYYEKQEAWELEGKLQSGIENKSIKQSFLENVFSKQSINNKLTGGGYNFHFSNGILVNFTSGDGYNSHVKDWFGKMLPMFYEEAVKFYGNDEDVIKLEINLQADCYATIPTDILKGTPTLKTFSYSNGAVNYIAIATYYDSINIELNTFLNSTHGEYEIIANLENGGLRTTNIKAYGKSFTFFNGHSRIVNIGDDIETEDNYFTESEGYIYVLINPAMEGLVKIGKTTKDPNERVKELSSATGVAKPFVLAYQRKFYDCHNAEKMIHQYLTSKGVRYNSSREFFEMPINEAIDAVLQQENEIISIDS